MSLLQNTHSLTSYSLYQNVVPIHHTLGYPRYANSLNCSLNAVPQTDTNMKNQQLEASPKSLRKILCLIPLLVKYPMSNMPSPLLHPPRLFLAPNNSSRPANVPPPPKPMVPMRNWSRILMSTSSTSLLPTPITTRTRCCAYSMASTSCAKRLSPSTQHKRRNWSRPRRRRSCSLWRQSGPDSFL